MSPCTKAKRRRTVHARKMISQQQTGNMTYRVLRVVGLSKGWRSLKETMINARGAYLAAVGGLLQPHDVRACLRPPRQGHAFFFRQKSLAERLLLLWRMSQHTCLDILLDSRRT